MSTEDDDDTQKEANPTGLAQRAALPPLSSQPGGHSTTLSISIKDLREALEQKRSEIRPTAKIPVLLRLENGLVMDRYLLSKPQIEIGRDRNAEIPLRDHLVSRRHARIEWVNFRNAQEHPRCTIEDLGSRNGTVLNERIIKSEELVEGDQIMVGATVLSYYLKDRAEIEYDQRLITLATTDSLTGLANRAAFLDHAYSVIPAAVRDGRSLAVALADIDRFKKINDTFGHHAGDSVLLQVAHAMIGALRDGDVLGRIGGEEFAILFPNTSPEAAMVVAEVIRQAVERYDFVYDNQHIPMTVSIGLTWLSPERTEWANLYQAADQLLYQAKREGRNCIRASANDNK